MQVVQRLTAYELERLVTMPFMTALHGEVRELLKGLVPSGAAVLDVGGRKSWYTVGLPFDVTVSDIPRESEIQRALHLGVSEQIGANLAGHRSNIRELVMDDMSDTGLGSETFDALVSVEVIEHVDDDHAFVANMRKVLRPGGVAILTTPNGDRDPTPRGDHRRHYRRHELEQLLAEQFDSVVVSYSIAATPARTRGLASWSVRHPLRTLSSATANVVNRRQSARPAIRFESSAAGHLIAVATRA